MKLDFTGSRWRNCFIQPRTKLNVKYLFSSAQGLICDRALCDPAPSIIGSDADRRLEEEKKAMKKLEMLMAEVRAKTRAKLEAQAVSDLLSPENTTKQFFNDPDLAVPLRELKVFPRGGGYMTKPLSPDFPLDYTRDCDPEVMKKRFLESQLRNSLGLPPNSSLIANGQYDASGNCCICFRLVVDPIRLECNHAFCEQCVLRILQGAPSDECPICSWNAETQTYNRMIHKEEMESWLPPPQHQQPIW
ncbi:uncharacterized protein LOC112346358 [Selaginella moellendorffii]|uniref:uncharacterized protein LOC112346358 n=1 Tax=Selaginella moellendorffii TaxID=88036 RepID=UPI000D1CFAFE|nr:uncharacterized protein LOC112346358 [Selaginella moellendorffii]|eukprot:XP_024530910.1 uncharacterized protein LOC112346358 [Selaginella moellendorffii]